MPFALSSLWKKINPFWSQASNILWSVASYIPSFGSGSLNFFKYFLDWKNVSELFREIHIKLWNVAEFGLKKETREKFLELFDKNNWTNTLETVKLLLQMPSTVSKYLKSESNLFNHLLLKFFDNPSEISRKFGRLSKNIVKELNKGETSCSSLITKLVGSKNDFYGLSQNDLDVYLSINKDTLDKEDLRRPEDVEKVEKFFEKLWQDEICMKHETGSTSSDWGLNLFWPGGVKKSNMEVNKEQAIKFVRWGMDPNSSGFFGLLG